MGSAGRAEREQERLARTLRVVVTPETMAVLRGQAGATTMRMRTNFKEGLGLRFRDTPGAVARRAIELLCREGGGGLRILLDGGSVVGRHAL